MFKEASDEISSSCAGCCTNNSHMSRLFPQLFLPCYQMRVFFFASHTVIVNSVRSCTYTRGSIDCSSRIGSTVSSRLDITQQVALAGDIASQHFAEKNIFSYTYH